MAKKFVAIREMKEETWKELKQYSKQKKQTIAQVIEGLVKEKKIYNGVYNFPDLKSQESETKPPQ